MRPRTFSFTAGAIFSLLALLHLLRLVYGWQAVLEGRTVPIWVSWVGLVVAGYLAYQGFKLAGKPQ